MNLTLPNPPPFAAGSLNVPRQLQRWLDINPQGGPLTRCRYFITLPAFSVNVVWNGVADIVIAFNFEAPKPFSLPCNVSQSPIAVPIAYNVIDITNSQTGTVIGAEGGQGIQ